MQWPNVNSHINVSPQIIIKINWYCSSQGRETQKYNWCIIVECKKSTRLFVGIQSVMGYWKHYDYFYHHYFYEFWNFLFKILLLGLNVVYVRFISLIVLYLWLADIYLLFYLNIWDREGWINLLLLILFQTEWTFSQILNKFSEFAFQSSRLYQKLSHK